jgi:hypothetical protein
MDRDKSSTVASCPHSLAPGSHLGGGGGWFEESRRLVLDACYNATHPDHPLVGLEVVSSTSRLKPHQGRAARNDIGGAEWTGRDHAGYPIRTTSGNVFRRIGSAENEIADFNDLRPDPQPAPDP